MAARPGVPQVAHQVDQVVQFGPGFENLEQADATAKSRLAAAVATQRGGQFGHAHRLGMIEAEVERFAHSLRTRDAAPLIRRLREDAERTKRHTLEQAMQMLSHGKGQQEALTFLANTLTNRLLHAPSQRLRDAAETGDSEVVETIAQIYKLDGDWKEFTPTERAMFTVAKKLAASPVVLTDDDVTAAVKAAGARDVVQLVTYVTTVASFDRITEAAGLRIEK